MDAHKTHRLVYPYVGFVSDNQIRTWLKDCIANDEVEYIGDQQEVSLEEVDLLDIEKAKEILDRIGRSTFADQIEDRLAS